MSSTTLSPSRPSSAAGRALLVAGAAVAAAVVNVSLATIAVALGAGTDFPPFQAPVLATFSVLGVLVGAAGWALVRRSAADPARVLRRLVPTVVVVSLLPDLALLATSMPGVGPGAVGALMATHLVVAALALPAFRGAMPLSEA